MMAIESLLQEVSEKIDKLSAKLDDFQMPYRNDEALALDVKDAAVLLGVSKQQVYTLINADPSFPATQVGERRTKINRKKLEAWLDRKTETRCNT